jgi:hypothetical protein
MTLSIRGGFMSISSKIFLLMGMIILFSLLVYTQDSMEDVVYLKNGSIIRGIIIEQIPGESLRLKTRDGNIFVFSFDEVERIVKEESIEIREQRVTPITSGSFGMNPDYGVSFGAWLGGEFYIEEFDFYIDKETSFMLQCFADFYLMEKLAMGIYANFSSLSFEDFDETASLYGFGISIKPRFILSDGSFAIKPGLLIGVRWITVDAPNLDTVGGLGINFSVEFQFRTSRTFIPYGIMGFLSQPAGGNEDTDLTFAPIFYIGAGVAF